MIERNNQLKVDKKQVALLGIAGLRDTPNRGNTWGQNGLTAEDLKKRFDALPLHVADKLNGLIDALGLGAVVVLDKKGNAYTLAEIASMAQTGGGCGGNGATFIPDVSEDGILSWTNDKDLPNPVPAKVTGKDGKTAYDYAKDGGYKGSEADFAARLAEDIPRSLSDLENDTGFIDAEGAPVQSVNGKTGAVSLLYEDVGADPSGTAYTEVSTHNTSDDAHSDIRLLLSALASRVNTALNSSDVDLDQLSEIVAYIKNNSSLIAGVTTSKVNVSDIIDNLTTNMASKPLSAAQGVALKALVDGKISLSGLQGAISSALAEAKASGEFDGEDGVGIAKIEQTGSAGASIDIYTITLTNGTSYTFSVTNGTKGDPGKDGTSPTVAVIKSGKVTTITITDKNGTKTATVNDGADGSSVSVSSVSESTADGGSNVVTFSDGKKVTVKNGKDGEDYVLTAADKQEIKNAIISSIITQEAGQSESLVMSQKAVTDLVEDALGSGGSTQYETVDSVDKMTDTSKQYVLSTRGRFGSMAHLR